MTFFVPGVDQAWLSSGLRKEASRLGLAVIVKAVAERGILGVRVWRIR